MIIVSKDSIFIRHLVPPNLDFNFCHYNFSNFVISKKDNYFIFIKLDPTIKSVKFPYIMFDLQKLGREWNKSLDLPENFRTIIINNVTYLEGTILEILKENDVIEKIDLSFRLTKDLGLLIVYFVETLSKMFFSKKASLKELFLEFWVDYNLTDDTIDYKRYSHLVPFQVTLRFTNISKKNDLCVAYIDKTFWNFKNLNLFLCRFSKTSPLRKLHKYIFKVIFSFLIDSKCLKVDLKKFNFDQFGNDNDKSIQKDLDNSQTKKKNIY